MGITMHERAHEWKGVESVVFNHFRIKKEGWISVGARTVKLKGWWFIGEIRQSMTSTTD
jgi:hypothetical protein